MRSVSSSGGNKTSIPTYLTYPVSGHHSDRLAGLLTLFRVPREAVKWSAFELRMDYSIMILFCQ